MLLQVEFAGEKQKEEEEGRKERREGGGLKQASGLG